MRKSSKSQKRFTGHILIPLLVLFMTVLGCSTHRATHSTGSQSNPPQISPSENGENKKSTIDQAKPEDSTGEKSEKVNVPEVTPSQSGPTIQVPIPLSCDIVADGVCLKCTKLPPKCPGVTRLLSQSATIAEFDQFVKDHKIVLPNTAKCRFQQPPRCESDLPPSCNNYCTK